MVKRNPPKTFLTLGFSQTISVWLKKDKRSFWRIYSTEV
jgi:hypothetical protein